MRVGSGIRRACLTSGVVASGQLFIQNAQAAEQAAAVLKTNTARTRRPADASTGESTEKAAAPSQTTTPCEAGCADSAHAGDESFLERCDCDKGAGVDQQKLKEAQEMLRRQGEAATERSQRANARDAQMKQASADMIASIQRARDELRSAHEKSDAEFDANMKDFEAKYAASLQQEAAAQNEFFTNGIQDLKKFRKDYRADRNAQNQKQKEANMEQLRKINGLGKPVADEFAGKLHALNFFMDKISAVEDERFDMMVEPRRSDAQQRKLVELDGQLAALRKQQKEQEDEIAQHIGKFSRGGGGSSSFLAA
ncbi:unnamed protein product [Amoebophrya sp. A120]|nr:unnamed protein product [Amoebophrya sp. A120]|eukprot:GSA120T00024704001.1